MALRNIMRYPGDDILKRKSRKVEKINERTLVLLEDMVETMYAVNGAGLAAVQVGILRRIVVIDDGTGLLKLINPVIVEASGEQQELEGCLSIPGIYGRVKRPERVVVRALNEHGESIEMAGLGLLARAFCHELDHLNGILFIDKVIPGSIISQNDLESEDIYK
jgi:peptide deformylase